MKILFLANRDLASNFALNQLLPQISTHHDLHLWLSAKVGNNNKPPAQVKLLKFFEQDLFNTLLSPLMSQAKIQANNTYKSFEQFNCFLTTKIEQVNQINAPAVVNHLKALSPDLIISIRYGCILKAPVITIPKQGVLNLHSGILPKYKGVMATFWALKNNDVEVGTTLHTIEDASIDTGHIIKISKLKAQVTNSYLWHVLELYKQGALDVLSAINTLEKGELLNKQPQKESDTYFTFPNQLDCNAFENKGIKMVDEQAYMRFIQEHYLTGA